MKSLDQLLNEVPVKQYPGKNRPIPYSNNERVLLVEFVGQYEYDKNMLSLVSDKYHILPQTFLNWVSEYKRGMLKFTHFKPTNGNYIPRDRHDQIVKDLQKEIASLKSKLDLCEERLEKIHNLSN